MVLYSGDNVNMYFDNSYIHYLVFITLITRLHLRFMYYSVNYTQVRSSPRCGKWYLENCRSRRPFIQSRNLGTAFVMSLEVSLL